MSQFTDEEIYGRYLLSQSLLPLPTHATPSYGPMGGPAYRDGLRPDWPRLMDPPYGNGFGHPYDPNQRDFLVNHVHEHNIAQGQGSRFLGNIIPRSVELGGSFTEFQVRSSIPGLSGTAFEFSHDQAIDNTPQAPRQGPRPQTTSDRIREAITDIRFRFNRGEWCCAEEICDIHDGDDAEGRELEAHEILATVHCCRRCDYHRRLEHRSLTWGARVERRPVHQFVQEWVMATP